MKICLAGGLYSAEKLENLYLAKHLEKLGYRMLTERDKVASFIQREYPFTDVCMISVGTMVAGKATFRIGDMEFVSNVESFTQLNTVDDYYRQLAQEMHIVLKAMSP